MAKGSKKRRRVPIRNNVVDIASWQPKTKLGKMVKEGKITLDQILEEGRPILEAEIVDAFLPNLEAVLMQMDMTQRVTDSGRKTSFRAIVVVGNRAGYVGLGVGKSTEAANATSKALQDAKRNIIKLPRGCGSWECQCGTEHSLPRAVSGKEGSTIVELMPAPKGVGLAVNDTIKVVMELAGIKDVWGKVRGSTNNVYNTLVATIKALKELNA
jgi:small subunit ribosomal protein S5